jgi:PAS domain S-box-containing protein
MWEEGKWSSFQKLWDSIFAILYGMNKKQVGSSSIAQTGTLFCFLQELSFPLSEVFPWNKQNINWLIASLKLTRLQAFDAIGDSAAVGAYSSLVLTVFFLGSVIHLVTDHYEKQKVRRPILVRVLRGASATYVKILLIPFILLMTKQIRCGNTVGCVFFSKSPIETVVLMTLIIGLVVYAFIYEATVYEWAPLSTHFNARNNIRATLVGLVVRILAAFFFGILEDHYQFTIPYKITMVSVFTAAYGITAFWHWYDLPYHSKQTNIYYVIGYSTLFWVYLCAAIVTYLNNDNDTSVTWSMYAVLVLVVSTSIFFVQIRYDTIENREVSSLASTSEGALKARILQRRVLDDYFRSKEDGLKLDNRFHEQEFRELDDLFLKLDAKFPGSSEIRYAWASYAFSYKRNRFLAMSKLRSILQRPHSVFDLWTCVIRIRYVSSKVTSMEKETDMMKYIERQRLEKKVAINCRLCIQSQLSFWSSLNLNSVTLDQLHTLTTTITNTMDAAHGALKDLILLAPTNPEYRRLYAKFLGEVANDEQGATAQVNKAIQIATQGSENRDDDLGDPRNGVIVVSGERDDMGIIQAVNAATEEIFKYTEGSMVGKKVGVLMPKFHGDAHNRYMARYIETKESQVVQKRRQMLMKDSLGYLFKADIQVREYANFTRDPRIGFLGIIYPQAKETSAYFTIRCNEVVAIDVSVLFYQLLFGSQPTEPFKKTMRITEVFPEFGTKADEAVVALRNTVKHTITVSRDNHNVPKVGSLTLHFQYPPFIEKDYLLVTIDKTRGDRLNVASEKTNHFKLYGSSFSRHESKVEESVTSMMDENDQEQRASSVSSRSSHVIRSILSRSKNQMDSSLRRMLLVIVLCTVGICLFSVAGHLLWKSVVFNRFKLSIDFVVAQSKLRWAMSTCQYSSSLFDHMQAGNLPVSELSKIQDDLKSTVSYIDAFKAALFKTDAWLSESYRQRVSSPVPLYVYDDEPEFFNSIEALHLYAGTCAVVTEMSWENLTQDASSMEFFKANRNLHVIRAVNDSIFIFETDQSVQNANTTLISEGFLFGAVTLIIVLALFVFLPTINSAEQQKVAVYQLFQSIPAVELVEIIKRTTETLDGLIGVEDISNNRGTEAEEEAAFLRKGQEYLLHKKQKKQRKEKKRQEKLKKQKEQDALDNDDEDVICKMPKFNINFGLLLNSSSKKLSYILFFVLLYFAVLHIWWLNMKDWLFDELAARVNLCDYRPFLVRSLSEKTFHWKDPRDIAVDEINELETMLWNTEHIYTYGDNKVVKNFIGRFGDISDFSMKRSLCQYVTNVALDECTDYMDGILNRGEHELILAVIATYENFRKDVRLTNSRFLNGSITLEEYSSIVLHKALTIKDLSDRFLPQVFSAGLGILRNEFLADINKMEQDQETVVVCFVIVNILLLIFIYRPMTKHLNLELNRTRSLVNIIPSTTIDNSPVLKSQLQMILSTVMKTTKN